MGTDQAEIGQGAVEQRSDPPGAVGVGEAVEAEASKRPALGPGRRDRIGEGLRGKRPVEGGVETGDRGQVGSQPAKGGNGLDRRRIVQGGQVPEAFELGLDLLVESNGCR